MNIAVPIVRASRSSDLPDLYALMEYADPGMVTMPKTRKEMATRVAKSQSAFNSDENEVKAREYFLVMEEEGRIIGTASIFTRLGSTQPFYNYRISRISKSSPEIGIKQDLRVLQLVNDCHGYAELGTLFLWPGARGKGRGRLLSLSRLLLIASCPVRFGERICAEIRGWTDDEGRSPFWDALGRKFFQMNLDRADRLSAHDNRFIADLMPPYPVYVELLPDKAQAVIGSCHPGAAPARVLLEQQGFRCNALIDIFDGGPCLETYTSTIAAVREAERRRARVWSTAEPDPGIVANAATENFAATMVSAEETRQQALARIGSKPDDEILFYRYKC